MATLPDSPMNGLPVLIVDDNEDAAMMLAESLSMKGYRVRVATDGPAALLAVADFQPAAALLDIGLPGMDGYELAAHLRADDRLPGLCIVAVTGYGQRADRERAVAAGFAAHLVKPVDIEHLDLVLRGMLAAND
jgi:CheY-like chemotaxis protein